VQASYSRETPGIGGGAKQFSNFVSRFAVRSRACKGTHEKSANSAPHDGPADRAMGSLPLAKLGSDERAETSGDRTTDSTSDDS
jgi:hypothetical protein